MSLQWKLGGFVLGGLMLLFGLLVGFGELLTQDAAQRMAAERMSVARLTASFLDRDFERMFSQLEWEASQINGGPSTDIGSARLGRAGARASDPRVEDLYLVDSRGQLVWSEPPGPSVASEDPSNEAFVREPRNRSPLCVAGICRPRDRQANRRVLCADHRRRRCAPRRARGQH